MKLAHINDDGHVRIVYHDIYDPVILPDENKCVFTNGKIENLPEDYILVEDHVPVEIGMYADEWLRDYDMSHKYVKSEFQQFKEEVKETVQEIKEEVKDLFDGDDEEDL